MDLILIDLDPFPSGLIRHKAKSRKLDEFPTWPELILLLKPLKPQQQDI